MWSWNCSPFGGLRDLLSDIVSDRNRSRPRSHHRSHCWSAMQFLISDYVGNFSLHCLSLVRCFWKIWWWSITEQWSACFLGWGFVMSLESVDLTIFIQLGNFSMVVSSCRSFGISSSQQVRLSKTIILHVQLVEVAPSPPGARCSAHCQPWRANPEPHEC